MRKDRNSFFQEANMAAGMSAGGYYPGPNMMPMPAMPNQGMNPMPNQQMPVQNQNMMYQGAMQGNSPSYTSEFESRLSRCERQINRLETRVNKLEMSTPINNYGNIEEIDSNISQNMYMV